MTSRRAKLGAILTLSVLAAGCVSSKAGWYRQGATAQNLAVDRDFCVKKSNQWAIAGAGAGANYPGYAVLGVLVANQDFNHCMEDLGWQPLEEVRASLRNKLDEQSELFAAMAAQMRSKVPGGPFCAGPGFAATDLTVLRVSAHASRSGLKQGDRLIAIDGSPVASLSELNRELYARSPGDTMEVGIEREQTQSTLNVRCADGRPFMDALLNAFDAGARGDWGACIPHVTEAEHRNVASSASAEMRLMCTTAYGIVNDQPQDMEVATLIYEATRLTLEESRFEAAGSAGFRATALARISWLESKGYTALAEDLRRYANTAP